MVTINTQSEFYSLLQGVVTDFSRMRFEPLLERGFRMLEEEHGVRFALESDPDGNPWQPLAPSTIKRKGHAIRLLETGRLRGSLRDRAHADGIREKGGKKLKFVFQTSINAPRQKTQAVVKQACQRAGIDLELQLFGHDQQILAAIKRRVGLGGEIGPERVRVGVRSSEFDDKERGDKGGGRDRDRGTQALLQVHQEQHRGQKNEEVVLVNGHHDH